MKQRQISSGFALPTVIITSVVMFGVLVAVLGMVTSTSSSLSTQYFEALAADAAESAASAAEVCLQKDAMTTSAVLKPNTDCSGTVVSGRSAYVVEPDGATRPYRTKYEARLDSVTSTSSVVKVKGIVERVRPNVSSAATNYVYQTYEKTTMLASTRVIDTSGDRPSQRYWYFGKNASLDFGLSGSGLAKSNARSSWDFLAQEGVTTVSDEKGNLQFMSNGRDIWDKNGNKVASGILGGDSASQAVAAFPLNKDRTKYAVVSNTGQAETGPGKLYVSTLTIQQTGAIVVNSAGLNTPLRTSSSSNYSYELLGAMPNNDGTGYYVYTINKGNGVGTIYRFFLKLNSAGDGVSVTELPEMPMDPAPVTCGTNYPVDSGRPVMYGAAGTINFSKDYKRMILLTGVPGCGDDTNGMAYLYSTDSVTGNLTRQASWQTHGDGTGTAYSADFSPQERYVYVSSIYPSYLVRYDIQDLSNVTEWKIGATTNITGTNVSGGQVRRGPDDRMYVANRAQLQLGVSTGCKISYVNKPDASSNTAGTAGIDLQIDALPIYNGSCSSWGLPQTVTVFKPRIILY